MTVYSNYQAKPQPKYETQQQLKEPVKHIHAALWYLVRYLASWNILQAICIINKNTAEWAYKDNIS